MKITEMLLTNKNARPGTRITPKGLVIHWTANEGRGANAVANRNYFDKPTTQASAHYCVDDKQIVRCLPETEMGYHVGAKGYKPDALAKLSSYPNNCTIGIEMCVNSDSNFKAMYQRTVELAADILKRYGWGVDKLWRHFDITGKNCPAFFVSDDKAKQYLGTTALRGWETFKQDVHKILTGNPQVESDLVDKPCNIEVIGKLLAVKGILQEGKSFLPVRAVAEAVGQGSVVGWCEANKTVLLNGKALTTLKIVNGTGYAWSKEIASGLSLKVEWVGVTDTVKLTNA